MHVRKHIPVAVATDSEHVLQFKLRPRVHSNDARMRTIGTLSLLAFILIVMSGCTDNGRNNTATAWQRSEMYFGLTRPDKTEVSEADWRDFVNNQVAVSFPGGFTELTAVGHYRENGESKSEPVRVLVILNPPDKRAITNTKLNSLGSSYCARFGIVAVLRADSDATLNFLRAE